MLSVVVIIKQIWFKVKGCKDLVLDPDLMKPLDRIAGATLLKVCINGKS